MSQKFKKTVASLLAAFALCAVAGESYADDCESYESELTQIEAEVEALEADCFAEIEAATANTDKCARELAAESAVRRALQADNASLERALNAEREKRIRTEERMPKKATWFAIGAASVTAAITLVAGALILAL